MLYIPCLLLLIAFIILFTFLARKKGWVYVTCKLSLILFLLFTFLGIRFHLSHTKESMKASENKILGSIPSEEILVLSDESGLEDLFLTIVFTGDEFNRIVSTKQRSEMIDYLETGTYRMLALAGFFLALYSLSSLMSERAKSIDGKDMIGF